MNEFVPSSTQKATFQPRYDADGKVFLQAIAHGNLTAKTPYKLIYNEYGPVTAALADDTKQYRVVVPLAAVDSGDLAWLQHGGYISDMITPSLSVEVGHALELDGGVVADAGADYSGGTSEFAVCATESSTSTTQDAMLIPREITATS
jgi:hypothetical protein